MAAHRAGPYLKKDLLLVINFVNSLSEPSVREPCNKMNHYRYTYPFNYGRFGGSSG